MKLIVITPEEMEQLVFNAVTNAMQQFENRAPKKTEKEVPIGIKEAAKILGIAQSTLRNNISRYPYRKRGGKLYFFEEELLAYIKAGGVV